MRKLHQEEKSLPAPLQSTEWGQHNSSRSEGRSRNEKEGGSEIHQRSRRQVHRKNTGGTMVK